MELFGRNIKNIWQLSAGDTNRDYVDLFLHWDVVLRGPGLYGRWPDCLEKLRNDGWKSKSMTNLIRYCETVEDGDLIVLRKGTKHVYGVGLVVGKYDWNDEFGDVDGWDLQHIRRVRWLWRYDVDNGDPKPKEFKTYDLKWGDTLQLLTSSEVLDWVKELEITDEKLNRELKALPQSFEVDESKLLQSISEFLLDEGMASDLIKNLQNEIEELIEIAKWYWRTSTRSSEYETISYLVIPLLRALGWTPQRMAIEWNNVDIAIFSKLPRDANFLDMIVEVKKKDSSCLTAVRQALNYAMKYGSKECKRLIVTDGIRYGIYLADANGIFNVKRPDAYLNLVRLREKYVIYDSRGAKEALYYMSPYWRPSN